MNEQQKRLHAATEAAANAKTPEEKSRADARIVDIITEKPKKRG